MRSRREYIQRIFGNDAELADGVIVINMSGAYHPQSSLQARRQLDAETIDYVYLLARNNPRWPWGANVVPEVKLKNRR